MILTPTALRALVTVLLDEWDGDGRDVAALRMRLAEAGDDLGAIAAVGTDLPHAAVRDDWLWEEPDDLAAIRAASAACPAVAPLPVLDDVAARTRTAFLARVAGCILGKPLELGLSRAQLQPQLEAAGVWPLDGYLPEAALDHLTDRQPQWRDLVRERITHVAEDDDLNYTVIGMRVLEEHGVGFTEQDLATQWRLHLPVAATFGPERARIANEAATSLLAMAGVPSPHHLDIPFPGMNLCGALIRADAYGYACPGDPALAAALAHRDAALTHRRTGIYGTMWTAATLAIAASTGDALTAAAQALDHVPSGSRFHAAVTHALDVVDGAPDWDRANQAVVSRYPEHGHCRILQEVGTMIVTFRFARDVGHGLCLQVMQANDTDSFGATAGSILGMAMGPSAFDEDAWVAPFRDRIHLALAMFHDTALGELADRMARLPRALSAG